MRLLYLSVALLSLSACGEDSAAPKGKTSDAATDAPSDALSDTANPDGGADTATDSPIDIDANPVDAPGDTPVDAPSDVPSDTEADAAACEPTAPGTGLVTLTAPNFSASISRSTPVFRTLTDNGKLHYPDGAVTFRPAGGSWEVYLASGRESYRLTGSSPTSVALDPASPVIAPTGSTSDPHHGYAGVTSVISCGGTLAAFFHGEYHAIPVTPWAECPAPYHASMARATSTGGSTFSVDTPAWFLTSSGTASYGAPKCAYGAGGGSIFDPGGDFLFLYYFDWDAPNGVYLARACKSECGQPGSWRKYHAGAFTGEASSSSFLSASGPSSAVVPTAGNTFDAFVVVSRNTYLDAYLMIAATESGYALRVSADGVAWGPRVPLLQHIDATDGSIPLYYPTLVDAQTWSRDTTGRHLKLIHAIVADDQGRSAPHRAFIADIELTRATDTATVTYDRLPLVRYLNQANPFDHWCTTSTSTGYPVEGQLGELVANSLPGTRPLYDCVVGGKDHMASQVSTCEGGQNLGIMGYLWVSAAPGRTPLFRCSMTSPEGGVDHLLSLDATCEGLTNEGLLGYVE